MSADDLLLGDPDTPEPRRCVICQAVPYASHEAKDDLIRVLQHQIDVLTNRLLTPEERVVLRARIDDLEGTVRRLNSTIEANNQTIHHLQNRRVG